MAVWWMKSVSWVLRHLKRLTRGNYVPISKRPKYGVSFGNRGSFMTFVMGDGTCHWTSAICPERTHPQKEGIMMTWDTRVLSSALDFNWAGKDKGQWNRGDVFLSLRVGGMKEKTQIRSVHISPFWVPRSLEAMGWESDIEDGESEVEVWSGL